MFVPLIASPQKLILGAASIPFVRFDGKMSQRRRQEAIERFSVPLQPSEEGETPPTTEATSKGKAPCAAKASRTTSKSSSSRPTRAASDQSRRVIIEDDYDDFGSSSGEEELKPEHGRASMSPGCGGEQVNPRVMLISLKAVSSSFRSRWPTSNSPLLRALSA